MIDRLDRRVLLKHVTGCSDADLIVTPNPELTPEQQDVFESMLARREAGEPVSKIIGAREFYSLMFHVNEDVLDPRPDTEILVDAALNFLKTKKTPCVLELGCGSGCISVTIAANHPDVRIDAVDVSKEALSVAEGNVACHGLQDRITLRESNWFDSVSGQYHLIISNPPYIESNALESLAPEVKNHDPILALDGGKDGLEAYRIIFSQARAHLYPQGTLMVEHGAGQEDELQRLMENSGFGQIRAIPDLSGTNRVLIGCL